MRRAPFVGEVYVEELTALDRHLLRRTALNERKPGRWFQSDALRLAYAALERRRARGES